MKAHTTASSQRRAPHIRSFTLVAVCVIPFAVAQVASAATFTVASTSDVGDFTEGDGSCLAFISLTFFACTFRAALEEANASPGPDIIRFNSIPLTSGIARLLPASPYPLITDEVYIDGYTAPGYPVGDDWAAPKVYLDGVNIGVNANGLMFASGGGDDSTVRGLTISGFSASGILLSGDGVLIQGCRVGPGFFQDGNGTNGIFVTSTGDSNTIGRVCVGTTCTGKGNVASKNGLHGIEIQGNFNTVAGNRVGTHPNGQSIMANGGWGIRSTGSGNRIGDIPGNLDIITETAGNLVSGNEMGGIQLTGIAETALANFVGTDADGEADLGNLGPGIEVLGTGTRVGPRSYEDPVLWVGNLVSGNQGAGISLGWSGFFGADSAEIRDNRIGINLAQTTAIGNDAEGILLLEGAGVEIEDNVVGGNLAGIELGGPDSAIVKSNWIGTTPSGVQIGNLTSGIQAVSADHQIGLSGAGNIIGGNFSAGIDLALNSESTVVLGNYIGMLPDGTVMGNGGSGIYVNSDSHQIGDELPGAENIIVNNHTGIRITSPSMSSIVWNNYIGTTPGGDDMGNSNAGVLVEGSVMIGALSELLIEERANDIAFNGAGGIEVVGVAANARIRGNAIHDNAGLGIDLGADGTTPNDLNDPDTGPNNLMNHPNLQNAFYDPLADELLMEYNIDAVPANVDFPISVDFYLSEGGEGGKWLGSDVFLGTDVGLPHAHVFTPSPGVNLIGGSVVATTTSDTASNTSEFSPSIAVPEPSAAFLLAPGLGLLFALARTRRDRCPCP